MRRFLLAAALAIPLLAGAAVATPTQAQAATCSGVWVVVDYGSLGGVSTKCATKYSTGTEALRSAGFSPTLDNGMITKISGKPSNPDINKAYWSYWHASRSGDGYGDWSYSNLGANSYHPTKGNAEGWRYQSLDDGKVPPSASPPKTETSTPTPTATKTSTKPKKSGTPTKSATATPSATKSATASKSASAGASASTTPVATTAATPTSTPLAANEATEVAQEQVTATPDSGDSGSPVGAIAAGAAVVVAGAGLGGWWLWRGRKR
ncbi:MAG: hypothetical protein LCH96_18175 [Actinobacteria bacterium]|nr:hypothetical protein [Actinomycetota bacterium]